MAKAIMETLATVRQDDGRKPFVCGIVLQGPVEADREMDVVVEAAPIVHRSLKHRRRHEVRRIAQERGWRVSVVWQMERQLP